MAAPTLARTVLLSALTLVAFAANSLLCRAALGAGAVDAASFTALRMVAGALALAPFAVRALRAKTPRPPWRAAIALVVYAAAFSTAYLSLTTGTGALLLFGTVQVTMIGAALVAGERPRPLEWLGLVAALAGLVWLVLPGLAAPPLVGAALMITAGVAWGAYSLLGRGAADPSSATAWSFARAAPIAVLLALVVFVVDAAHVTPRGALLAVVSGAVTSGGGYVLWYAALKGHTATSASIVQLAVPVLAAIGGVALLSEDVTTRLVVASALVVGGVAVAVVGRRT